MNLQQKNPRQGGFGLVTMMFMTFLAIMVLLAAANAAALIRLHREVRLVEQQQIKRLNASQTNPVPVVNPNAVELNSK